MKTDFNVVGSSLRMHGPGLAVAMFASASHCTVIC